MLAALGVLLAGCGSGSSSTSIRGQGQPVTMTPVPASGWTTYSNTTYGYTIQYPANWFTSGTSSSADDIEIYNFDPSQLDSTDTIPPPPFNKDSLDAFANPSHLAMSEYYAQYRASDPSSPPANSQTQRAATVAGRSALEVIQQTVQWSGGNIAYPSVTYFVPDGDNVLILNELYSPGGQPSAVFAHIVSSLKFGK